MWWCFLIDATQYVYVSEIWPNHLRSQGTALGVAAFYLASEVTLVAAPVALNDIGWKYVYTLNKPNIRSMTNESARFYLVLICPSVVYITLMYFFFPETKGRTLEEIGGLFGDESHVASHWYGISEEEKQKIAEDALQLTKDGRLPQEPKLKPPVNDVDSNHESKKSSEIHDESKVENASRV